MSGGIIAFPIRVCHGLDSNILDKLLTWWYRNKKKSVIMVFTRVREATSFYCRRPALFSSMCEKEFFSFIATFSFTYPKGVVNPDPLQFSFFLPHMTQKTTIHDYSCRSCLLLMFSLIFFLPRLFRCDGDGEPSYPRRPDRSAREDEHPAHQLHHQVGHRDFRHSLQFTAADML